MVSKYCPGVIFNCLNVTKRLHFKDFQYLTRTYMVNIASREFLKKTCWEKALAGLGKHAYKNRSTCRTFSKSLEDSSLDVKHDTDAKRFFLVVDGLGRAYLEYEREDQLIKLMHTEVPQAFAGRGYGKVLAKEALEYVAKNDYQLEIHCEYVRNYVSNYAPNYVSIMNVQDFEGILLYYGRSEYFHTMQKTALDGLARFPTNVSFRLYNGIALVLGNRVQEGIRELNPLKNDGDLGVSALTALLYAHNQCSIIDKDTVVALEDRLKESFANANANAYYNAGMFLLLAKKFEKACEFADKALKLDNKNESAAVLKSWAEINKSGAGVSGNTLHILEQILNRGKNIDATLALVSYFQLHGQFENAINLLNQLSVRYPELNIPLIVKMETHMAALDWDHAFETALRIINLDPTNIAALRVKSLLLIIRDGNAKGGISTLQQLLVAAERVEVGNSRLILQICRLFSRICSRNADLLTLTLRFIDKLIQTNPNGVDYVVELGNQRMLLGNIKEATICYRSAVKIESHNIYALCGLTLCQLLENGNTEHTRQQVEFLNEHRLSNDNPFLNLLNAKIVEKNDIAIDFLSRATEIHMRKLDGVPFGPKYTLHLDPEFLLQVAAELLRISPLQIHVNQGINLKHDALHISLKHCISILDVILKFCPAHIQAIFTRAKVHFLCGELALASSLLQRIIKDIDATYTDAYLLLSQIQIQQQQYVKALQSLELALSFNFVIRDNPRYYLLLGMGQRQRQQYDEAKKSFISAMHLLGNESVSRERIKSPNKRSRTDIINNFTLADKVTLYLELISTYKDNADAQGIYESERLLQCAMEEFKNTSEEGRLVIAHAEFMLQNANFNKAIQLLSAIQPGQSYYIQAKTHLANIYLQYRKDRVAFARCFKELVEACPESESYSMLGEAYMSIQEPDLAVESYQKALEINSQDSLLASKLGRAYVKTHQYSQAISFYKDILTNPEHTALNLDLAELYLKLRQYKDAEKVLAEDIDQTQIDNMDVDALQLRSKRLLLLARVHEKSGDNGLVMEVLGKAKENQYVIQKRLSIHQTGNNQEQYKILSK